MRTVDLCVFRRSGGSVLGLLGLLSLGLIPTSGCSEKPSQAEAPPAVTVSVAVPLERETIDFVEATGKTKAVESVDIRARVSGYLDKVGFQDGAEVSTKDEKPLFEIDPRPFQAQYDRAVAQWKLAKADLQYREAEVKRNQPLVQKGVVTQADYDQIVAAYQQADAAVGAADANAKAAKLNLDFTKIFAPIDGRIDRALITPGNLVQADQTLLTNIVAVDKMDVYFDVDERTVLDLQKQVREGKLKARNDDQIPVFMGLDNENGYPHKGVLDFSANQMSRSTGTIELRARFANPKPATGTRVLMPGNHARVQIPVSEPYKALMISERAIGTQLGRKFVLVIDADGAVAQRWVELGRLDAGLRVITKGLKADDQVIVVGKERVQPGRKVTAKRIDMTSVLPEGATQVTNPAGKVAE